MKKIMPLLLALVMVAFTGGLAAAQVPVPDTIYKWVQSSPRANYYFNMEQLCFAVDEKGFIDQNTLLVAVVKTYDPLQIKDVQDKRQWKMLNMDGYDDLAGAAEYARIDLAKQTVTITEVADLDSTGTAIETTYPNRTCDLKTMSDKSLDRIFFGAVIDYAKQHKEQIIQHTKGKVKPEDLVHKNDVGKKKKNNTK